MTRQSDPSIGADPNAARRAWRRVWAVLNWRRPLSPFEMALNRTVDRWVGAATPWALLGFGVLVTEVFITDPPARGDQLSAIVAGPGVAAIGSLWLGLRLFVATVPQDSGFTRPVGQMLIGTVVSGLLAIGLAGGTMALGAALNAGDPTRAPLDARTMTVAATLFVAQGIGLPLYAWWRWFGDRDLNKLIAGLVKTMQEDTASKNAVQLQQQAEQIRQQQDELRRLADERRRLDVLEDAPPTSLADDAAPPEKGPEPPENEPEPEPPSGPRLMAD